MERAKGTLMVDVKAGAEVVCPFGSSSQQESDCRIVDGPRSDPHRPVWVLTVSMPSPLISLHQVL